MPINVKAATYNEPYKWYAKYITYKPTYRSQQRYVHKLYICTYCGRANSFWGNILKITIYLIPKINLMDKDIHSNRIFDMFIKRVTRLVVRDRVIKDTDSNHLIFSNKTY